MRAGDSTADVRQMGAHVLSALARRWASDHRMWSVLWRRTREESPICAAARCVLFPNRKFCTPKSTNAYRLVDIPIRRSGWPFTRWADR